MTTPVNPALPDPTQPEPDKVIADAPVIVSPVAIEAAKAELAQIAKDVKAGVWSRTLRTLAQGVAATAFLAVVSTVYNAVSTGTYDWKTLAFSAGQAALTAVVTYAHNKFSPAKN